jgi:hypothetical protein
MLSRSRWLARRTPAGSGARYLLRDEFSTDRAGGAVHGTAAEPGPGNRVVVDTENKLSLAGGLLVLSGGRTSPTVGDPGLWLGAVTRAAGRCLAFHFNRTSGNYGSIGFDTNQSGAVGDLALDFNTSNNLQASVAGNATGNIVPGAAATDYQGAIVLRPAGAWLFLRGGAFPDWFLYWVDQGLSAATLYPCALSFNAVFAVDYLRVLDLPAPYNSDFGIATQRLAGARAPGDAFGHEADFLLEWVTQRSVTVTFREQDENNYWAVAVWSDGTLALNEVVNGTTTTRGTAASGTVANGHRVLVIAHGQTLRVFTNNILRITHSSAANFATRTNGRVLSGDVADVVSWPRVLSGMARAALRGALP